MLKINPRTDGPAQACPHGTTPLHGHPNPNTRPMPPGQESQPVALGIRTPHGIWGLMLLAVLLVPPVTAQSLRVEQVSLDLTARDTTAKTIPITFEVSWEDSWRDDESWDAVWLFAKFERAPGTWADLRFTPDGHEATGSPGAALTPAALPAGHANGLLLHRGEPGQGDLQFTVRALWTYGASYYDVPPAGVSVRVMGVELVRVPGGPFEVGEGTVAERQPNSFQSGEGRTYRIASESEIAVGLDADALFYNVPEGEAYVGGDQAGPIPASFPKGAAPFYVMKYPVTQGQYAAFLSLLPPRARAARDVTTYPTYAEKSGTISCNAGACEAARPNRAANFLSWSDGIGWASWAGLRPMTEFEYEKAAAGTEVDSARYADGALPDRIADVGRRSQWGAVDLRGGLWERVVSVGTAEGRQYRGTRGQGYVDDLGYPYGFINADWPGPRALGSGYRGGTEGLLALSEVADRTYAAYEATYGNEGQGFRAVLDAP
ncbi:MAG: SUMF1/EgtB/PvdO family nonheme iron enzyme [Bacteroidota bacterium]